MSNKSILIVEDDNLISLDLQSILSKKGYISKHITTSGEETLELLEKETFDIVLMDINLQSKMSGIEVARQIKDLYEIPVIFLTAYADEKTLNLAKKSEPYAYVLKPVVKEHLFSNIEIALYKHEKYMELKIERNLLFNIVGNNKASNSIFVRADHRLNKIIFTDIFYVEAQKDCVIINTVDKSFRTHSSMKDLIKILPEDMFIRVHKSYIVQINKIYSIKFPFLLLENIRKEIPIGGFYRKELYKQLNIL